MKPVATILIAFLVMAGAAGLADVPRTISYQGLLEDGGIVLPTGDYSLTFRIYGQATGGAPLWSEAQVVAVVDGVFSATLGSITPLTLAFDNPCWITLQVGAEPELPRLPFTSAPYAYRAAVADSVVGGGGGGGDITGVIAASGLTGGATHGDAILAVGEGPGVTVESDRVRLADTHLSGEAYDARFVNEGQASSISAAMIQPEVVSSVDGVGNDGGDIDLVAGTGITITPDNASNRITFTSTSTGIGGSGMVDYIPKFTGSSTIGSSTIYDNGDAVGIGTTTPGSGLAILESTSGAALTATTDFSGSSGQTVNFERSAGIGTSNDVLQIRVPSSAPADAQFIECEAGSGNFQFRVHTNGDTEINGDLSVEGSHEVVSTGPRAGNFETNSTEMEVAVVHAQFTGATGDAVGVWGKSIPRDWYGFGGRFQGGYLGVEGIVRPTGGELYRGVMGSVSGGTGNNMALYGTASGTGNNYGLYAHASGGAYNYAGYFVGNVSIFGTLSKSGGSFKIDHPLDPENKYLYHSFVESPDMMNVYNGNVVLDANGEARIQMPDWFEALNRDFRYQLTPIGAPGPNLHIAQKVSEGAFAIAGGTPGMEVSWQVTGIRHDAYAEAHRIPVEQDKPTTERGKYLHPDLYGMPESRTVGYVQERQVSESAQEYESSRTRHARDGVDE